LLAESEAIDPGIRAASVPCVEAREHLRLAFDTFDATDARAFAGRARRELQATAERVRNRNDSTRTDTHAPGERGRRARQRLTNGEIGAQLFLSARTVEWHVRNVFAKPGIGSRRQLEGALGPPAA